jgi:hypothetical protein
MSWKRKLLKLEIKYIGKRFFKMIEGRFIKGNIWRAVIEYKNKKATTIVVIAEAIPKY